MHDGGAEGGKANAISHDEEGAEMKLALLLIGGAVEVEVGVDDAGDVVNLAGVGEEVLGEDGEDFGVVDVGPVADGGDDVHDEEEADGDVGGGEPRAGEGAAEVGRDGGPVEADGGDAEAMEARAELLGEYVGGEDPANPREGGEHLEEIAWENVVSEAADEGDHEELSSAHAAFRPLVFLVESSVFAPKLPSNNQFCYIYLYMIAFNFRIMINVMHLLSLVFNFRVKIVSTFAFLIALMVS